MTERDKAQRTLEENKVLVRRLFDVFAGRSTDVEGATAELLAPGFVHRFDTDHAFDRTRYLQAVGVFYRAFPDLEYRIEDIIAEHDRVVVRYHATGTHMADFFGLPATGKSVTYGGVFIYRLADGLIQEDWEHWDGKGFHLQLGLLTAPERGG